MGPSVSPSVGQSSALPQIALPLNSWRKISSPPFCPPPQAANWPTNQLTDQKTNWPTDPPTNRPTNQPTNRRTRPLIEMRTHLKKGFQNIYSRAESIAHHYWPWPIIYFLAYLEWLMAIYPGFVSLSLLSEWYPKNLVPGHCWALIEEAVWTNGNNTQL